VSFLLDTNVVSEWVKLRSNPGVVDWLAAIDEDRVHLSVVTLAELRHGITRMIPGIRRRRLEGWFEEELKPRFQARILPIDERIADAWGEVVAAREREGRAIGVMDAFIAATAWVHGLTLVTRNVADFAPSLPEIINPWIGA